MVLERSSQISTIGLLDQHLNLDLRCLPLFVQPHPTKSSTFDGNYMAGTGLHELFQSLTHQFDPTPGHQSKQLLSLKVVKQIFNRRTMSMCCKSERAYMSSGSIPGTSVKPANCFQFTG